MAFTFTSLPLNPISFLFPDVVVVSDLSKNTGGSTDLAIKERQASADVYTPIYPPL